MSDYTHDDVMRDLNIVAFPYLTSDNSIKELDARKARIAAYITQVKRERDEARRLKNTALEGLLVVFNAQGLDGPEARKEAGKYLTRLHDAEVAAARESVMNTSDDSHNVRGIHHTKEADHE